MYGIFPYIYHKFMPNVGKYPMDPMGMGFIGSMKVSLRLSPQFGFKYDDVCDFDLPHQTFASWNGEVVYCIYVM